MRLSKQTLLESTIDSLYEAVTDETQWAHALAGLGRAFDSPKLALVRASTTLDTLYEVRYLHHEPETLRLYNEYYQSIDPTHRMTQEAQAGHWLDWQALFDPVATPQPEFVNDFAIPRGVRWVAGGKVHADAGSCTVFSLQRPDDHKPFGPEAERVFTRLSSHIGRASALGAELRRAELAQGLSIAALDALQWPVYAVDATARLVLANRLGEAQLRRRDPFVISAGRLGCAEAGDMALLQHALHQSAARRAAAFRIVGPQRTWSVRTVSIAHLAGISLVYAASSDEPALPAAILRQLLHFSKAESDIAFLLGDGQSVKQIADQRGVSMNTVRAQVKVIFQKAGVRRQSELTKLLMGIPRVGVSGSGP